MYLKIILFLISLLVVQPCVAEVSMYDDVKISPIQAVKSSPQLAKEYIEIQPYVFMPIINGIFAHFISGPSSYKTRIRSYETEFFIENHKDKIQEFKEIPLIQLITDKDEYKLEYRFVQRFDLTEEDYPYKLKMIDLLETTYGFSEKQELSLGDEQLISSIICYTNSRDFEVYEHIVKTQKFYDYNLAFIYYSLYGDKRTAKKVKKHILKNSFEEYYAKQMKKRDKKENSVVKEIKDVAVAVTAPVTIPYQLFLEPVGILYSRAHREWKEDVKFKIYKEKRMQKR